MKKGPTIFPLAPAHLAGLGAFQTALVLAFIDIRLAALPLALFLLLCFAAPFFPRFSFYLPIVHRGSRDSRSVALTFDDGPDPAATPALLDLLAKHGVPAAFFITGQRASRHPDLVRMILSRGHAVCNHSYNHSPFLMLRGIGRLREEINRTQVLCARFGILPLAFRPPVGITNPRLWRALLEAGMFCVNFSRRGRDAGNRRIRHLSKKIVGRARPGDIILLHDSAPGGFDADRWLNEIESIITGLSDRDLGILPLDRLIGRPVMKRAGAASTASHATGSFYDGIALTYDRESSLSGNISRRKERELFESNFLPQIKPDQRVLEIGAGTGMFTLQIAGRCREITAFDISEGMLSVMRNKAEREGLTNIDYQAGDVEEFQPARPYDIVCSFSAFEYIPDLEGLLTKISRFMAPGGILYFTTSHRSFFRFFTQVGNALRQGIWLHARSEIYIRNALIFSGFTPKQVRTSVLKTCRSGGMLIESMAEKAVSAP
ncbi:MAG: polysaccharide deacetylase family protein [Spirochaetes bacterium]|nr:polysaccharide deacetylase family protein [Spirochaetota bacterium]